MKLSDYEPDVREYLLKMEEYSHMVLQKDDVHINSLGVQYQVLEHSPKGEENVKVKTCCPFGISIRLLPKIILFS